MQKKTALYTIFTIIFVFAGVYSLYQYRLAIIKNPQGSVACTMEAKLCPDGSFVGRTGLMCEFAECPENAGLIYKNNEYGFEITFPNSWAGYVINKDSFWKGITIDGSQGEGSDYNGQIVIFKNPQTNANQQWQDIPIMVFNPEVWKLVEEEKVSVSAAPIPPSKIGENEKYVFATPARWYGFTNTIGFEEAVEIVKTFKAF